MPRDAFVHLIDDDEPVRAGLSFMLGVAGLQVSPYASADAFLAALPSVTPGCVVTDIRMPGMDGLQLQRELNRRGVAMPLIVITGHGDVPLAVQAMKAGAVDFIEKPFRDATLLTALRLAYRGEANAARRGDERRALQAKIASLEGDAREVFRGFSIGQTHKAIADGLGVSVRDVEEHRALVMTRLGATNMAELIRMSIAAEIEWNI